MSKFNFSDVVLVLDNCIGVVCKVWENTGNSKFTYDIYVRSTNTIILFPESEVHHYIYDKELSKDQMEYQQ